MPSTDSNRRHHSRRSPSRKSPFMNPCFPSLRYLFTPRGEATSCLYLGNTQTIPLRYCTYTAVILRSAFQVTLGKGKTDKIPWRYWDGYPGAVKAVVEALLINYEVAFWLQAHFYSALWEVCERDRSLFLPWGLVWEWCMTPASMWHRFLITGCWRWVKASCDVLCECVIVDEHVILWELSMWVQDLDVMEWVLCDILVMVGCISTIYLFSFSMHF